MKPYTHFTLNERICLEVFLKNGKNFSEIGRLMGRDKSTISREVKRNSDEEGKYNPCRASAKAT
ncbi:MAG: helix-turn-helix domain-containing protein, partial [Ruminiclostridium sp.]|nr:helix-turn-helix domain-containing protein [Ruminiclostridium sp.]